MSKFCRHCGTTLQAGVKFCAACGTQVQPIRSSEPAPSPAKQRKAPPKKLLFSIVAAALALALGLVVLPRIGGESQRPEEAGGDLSVFAYSERDYPTTAKKLDVSPESPAASADGVTIEFGAFGLEEPGKVEIRKLPEKTDKKSGVKVTAYDFRLGNQTDFDDVITIAIPYDKSYAEAGAEGECIGAKYYNQSTGEWEGIPYEVDTANRQVLIYTTHLSTYGVFQVKNENTRKAYITDVYAVAGLLNTGSSFEVIEEFAERGQPGPAALEAGFGAVNSAVGHTGTAITLATLGGQYDSKLVQTLGDGSQHLGLALAAVQTCYDFIYHFSDQQDKISTLASFGKNIANNAVGYFGSAALQTGFAAVAVFDVVLSEIQSDMMELKLENLGGVYQYYNDVEAPRPAKEWRRIFLDILRENAGDPAAAQQLMEAEIDRFCDRFWELDYGTVKEVAGVSGLRYSFDERQWTKDREVLTAQYREHLLTRLQAPLTSARNYLLRQAQEQAQREFEKQLRLLQRELNQTVQVRIIEQPEQAGKYQYGGYTVRFAPLSESANAKNWTGKMPKGGELNTAFTLLGHLQSGSPNTVELYPPGKQSPELTVGFQISHPVTTIYLSSQEEEEDDISSGASEPERPYHWVLVDTVLYDGQEAIDIKNEGYVGVYDTRGTASPGHYSVSWNYVGKTDTYYDPPVVHGEGEGSQAIFSTPPSTIKAGETVSLSLSLSFTENTLSFYDGRASASANFDKWDVEPGMATRGRIDFCNQDGQSYFEIYSSVKYSEKNVLSLSETLTAVAPLGHEEGERIAIRTTYSSSVSMGANYVYEWRPAS